MYKFTYKIKLLILIIAFSIFAGLMFSFGYSFLESSNSSKLDLVNKQNLELEVLKREQKNFEQGQKDLAALEQKLYPPQDLFSRDTKVVKEIKILEGLASLYSLDLTISISGTTGTAIPATGVKGELLTVPYTLTVQGAFKNILNFIAAIEHTNFVTQTNALQISSQPDNVTTAVLSSFFYLKK